MRFLFVMPVLVTGIHVWKQFGNEAVDGRDKPGHDQLEGRLEIEEISDGHAVTISGNTASILFFSVAALNGLTM
jgi:hypothetical protein